MRDDRVRLRDISEAIEKNERYTGSQASVARGCAFMRDDRVRLRDISEAIEKNERYTGIDKKRFDNDELIQTWMVYHLQIIGEAVTQLSDNFLAQHPDIPWRAIAAMRHILVHAYFRVDLDEVWSVIQNDLPNLKVHIQQLL